MIAIICTLTALAISFIGGLADARLRREWAEMRQLQADCERWLDL